MLRITRPNKVCFYIPFLFYYLIFLAFPFNSAHAGGVLPDTGQTKCYNVSGEIPCPAPGELFHGQEGNYQGAQPAYQVSTDGLIVTDLNTGLMWQKADDGQARTWQNALSYCEALNLAGHADWRLPSRLELVSIVDYGRYDPSINPAFSCQTYYYWSGSTLAGGPNIAWLVYFFYGYTGWNDKNSLSYVRCVRGGP